MPFTISKNDEEADDVQPVLDRINQKFNRNNAVDDSIVPRQLATGHRGGRMYPSAWDDPTFHERHIVAVGGPLFAYAEDTREDKLIAIGDACKKEDVTAVKSHLGLSRLGGPKKYIGVDLGFKCQGHRAVKTFMQALPADLEALDINLKGNHLMMPGIEAFADGLPRSLQQLRVELSNNKLHVQGLEKLMKAIPRSVIRLTLGCGGMRMGLPGVKAIADNLPPTLTEFTIDLYDGLMGDEGCEYLSRRLPKTLERFELQMKGDQGYLTNRGYWIFDRLIGDPENEYGLPKLAYDNFCCLREDTRHCVQQYEVTQKERRLVQRWGPHENVC